MLFAFDPAKDKANKAKHGLSLAPAMELEWDWALVWVDDRFDYDEQRLNALVPRQGSLYFVTFVDRGRARRIISLRPATRREVETYEELE